MSNFSTTIENVLSVVKTALINKTSFPLISKETYEHKSSLSDENTVIWYQASGSVTINLSSFKTSLSNNQSMFRCYHIDSTATGSVTISGADNVFYIGDSSEVKIGDSKSVLINIMLHKDASGKLKAYVQGAPIVSA